MGEIVGESGFFSLSTQLCTEVMHGRVGVYSSDLL